MGVVEERKALDRLSAAHRSLIVGGRRRPAETPPEEGEAQPSEAQQPTQAQGQQ